MKEFILATLPYVIIGLSIVVICVNNNKTKKLKTKVKDSNYLLEGMVVGITLGASFATSLKIDLGLGISLGMLIGEAIGSAIKKEK